MKPYKISRGKGKPSTKNYWVQLKDHRGEYVRFSAFESLNKSCELQKHLENLIARRKDVYCVDDMELEPPLWRWAREQISSQLRNRLIELDLLPASYSYVSVELADIIDEFEAHLLAKERTEKRRKEVVSTVKTVFDSCKIKRWAGIKVRRVEDQLLERRDNGRGISKTTYNHIVGALKQFTKWVKMQGKATIDPLDLLQRLDNPNTDPRHSRRALTDNQLRRLLETTQQGPEKFGMTGKERRLLYYFAAETGLRTNEIRTLTVRSFDFDNRTVTIKAQQSKAKKRDVVQPLKKQLAMLLKDFFKGKMPDTKAFGGRYKKLTDKTADMMKFDLANTVVIDGGRVRMEAIPYEDDEGAFADFHSLRHTFITNLREAPSRIAQKLARHSTSEMTDRYTHRDEEDEREALESLPDLSQPSAKVWLAKEGTND